MAGFIRVTERATGRTLYYQTSDFCGGCWHIYLAENYDTHMYNVFSEEAFNSRFEPFNRKKCDAYIASIRNR